MRGLRTAAVAVGIAAILAAVARLRGSSPGTPETGGWRELEGDDLSAPPAGG